MKRINVVKKLFFVVLMTVIIIHIQKINTFAENESAQELGITYKTHIQDIGWQSWKNNGETAGTSGQSKRLEAMNIKLINNNENIKINYKVHIQDIGWQSWKKGGELAGTEGQSKRLEAIKINLENTDKYSVMYRVHVQDIGWQSWKKDGELAGTEGKAKRLEAIEIKIIKKDINEEIKSRLYLDTPTNNSIYYPAKTSTITVKGWKMANVSDTYIKAYVDDKQVNSDSINYYDRKDVTSTVTGYGTALQNPKAGYKFDVDILNLKSGKHTIKIESYYGNEILTSITKDFSIDTNIHVEYSTHIEDIGWQSKVKDGENSGTTGKAKRIEALKITTVNLPVQVSIKYQAHIQDIGWQDWKEEGQVAGTEGKSKRIEAIRLLVENTDDYSIMYRVHIQDIGWQEWKTDGDIAGTEGKSKRIEAIQIKFVNKIEKGKICVETNIPNILYGNKKLEITGWKLSNVTDAKFITLIDDNEITDIQFSEKNELFKKVINYGNEAQNITPSFKFSLNTKDLEEGKHKVIIKLMNNDMEVLDSYEKEINIDKGIHVKYQTHIQDIGWQSEKIDGQKSGTEGKSLRIEAIKINGINLPENMKIKYKAHVENIGWQNWKNEGELVGTEGKSLRIESIKIKLDGTEEYSIMYRTHVENIGWQEWCYDAESSGTIGKSQRIEAIEIKIVPKIKNTKASVNIDNISNKILKNNVQKISGWVMKSFENYSIEIKIDNKSIDTSKIKWNARQDVLNAIKGYGDEETYNKLPGFQIDIDFSKYSVGKHTITVSISDNNNVISEKICEFYTTDITFESENYGYSGLKVAGDSRGTDLKCYRFGDGPNVFFAVFEVHGFEDSWDRDGKCLTNIAMDFYNNLVSSLDSNIAKKWTIYIFPQVNPDGINYGYTNNGPGRTTLYSKVGQGIDINRSWQVGSSYQRFTSARNFNGTEGFQAYEAHYLRDFILSHKSSKGQNVLVDLHGWEDQLIGTPQICSYYKQYFPSCSTYNYGSYGKQYIISWANSLGMKTALVELPIAQNQENANSMQLSNKYIEATLKMLREI